MMSLYTAYSELELADSVWAAARESLESLHRAHDCKGLWRGTREVTNDSAFRTCLTRLLIGLSAALLTGIGLVEKSCFYIRVGTK